MGVAFEDDEVVWNFLGYRVGQRCKITDCWGKDRHVVYLDEFGQVVSTAREIHPSFGIMPYVGSMTRTITPEEELM